MEEEMMNMQQSPTDQPIADATIESDGMLPAGLGDLAIDDPFNSPTPGESLTKNPEEKFPWEQASEYTEVRPFMEDLFLQLTEDKDRYVKLLVSYNKFLLPIQLKCYYTHHGELVKLILI